MKQARFDAKIQLMLDQALKDWLDAKANERVTTVNEAVRQILRDRMFAEMGKAG